MLATEISCVVRSQPSLHTHITYPLSLYSYIWPIGDLIHETPAAQQLRCLKNSFLSTYRSSSCAYIKEGKQKVLCQCPTKTDTTRISVVITLCVTHKVLDHHLQHEWQWQAALTPNWPSVGENGCVSICNLLKSYSKQISKNICP
jgi:hypothetical protein